MAGKLNDVISASQEAGQVVMPYFSNVTPDTKQDGSWITKADHKAHDFLCEQLVKIDNIPVLSEELNKHTQQSIIKQSPQSFWCIDPIDGTSNFTLGIPYWCISIARIVDGLVDLAVVYDPNQNEVFAAEHDLPSEINGEVITSGIIDKLSHATAIIDLKRSPKKLVADLCAKPPYRSQRSLGASALELCWVAADRCQLYLHGGQHLWDHAAAIKILNNAGGHACRFDGIELSPTDLRTQSVIAASGSALYHEWQYYLARYK